MKIRLNQDEMLSLWRIRHALEPLHSDGVVTRADGIDLDRYLLNCIDDWYLNLLDTASVEYLAPADIKADVAVKRNDDNSAVIILPERCRRIIEVKLNCWLQPALIITDPASPDALLQQNPYSRGNPTAPVAIVNHRKLILYSIPDNADTSIDRLLCIVNPDSGYYEMDQRALSLINQKHPLI